MVHRIILFQFTKTLIEQILQFLIRHKLNFMHKPIQLWFREIKLGSIKLEHLKVQLNTTDQLPSLKRAFGTQVVSQAIQGINLLITQVHFQTITKLQMRTVSHLSSKEKDAVKELDRRIGIS